MPIVGATAQTPCATGFTSSVGASECLQEVLNADGSASPTKYAAATDGVLIMRYLLGFTGTTLTDGALGATATRDAAQIITYLDGVRARLDVDGDGNVFAFTDGVMILRRLLGLTGSAVTNGAKLGTLTDAQIEAAVDALRPN